jgi:hypothetical protein
VACFLFIVIPIGWAINGRLLGPVVSFLIPTRGGRRAGALVGRHGTWLLPVVYLALLITGGSGNAGWGFLLFGSEELFELICMPWHAVPFLGGIALVGFVYQSLTRKAESAHGDRIAPG